MVESCNTKPALAQLNAMSESPTLAHMNRNKITLCFDGYDDDPRPLYQVAAVRQFLRMLDAHWPYWYFFLSLADESIVLATLCICDATPVSGGKAAIDSECLRKTMSRHFNGLNRMIELTGSSESLNEAISNEVVRVICGVMPG